MIRRRRNSNQPSGGVLVWKPAGITSRGALEEVERRLGVRGLGHAGTLDPLASGILILLGGEARKFQNLLTSHTKEYVARMVLGVRSHSDDGEGPLWSVVPRPTIPDAAAIAESILAFRGEYTHVPPRLSAVRVAGRRSYERARAGEDVEPEARTVTLHDVEVLSLELPNIRFGVRCDAGTYVRSLVRDIGEQLGTGAFLAGLRRTEVGPFREADAVPLHQIGEGSWIPTEKLLEREPGIEVNPDSEQRLRNGQKVDFTPQDIAATKRLRGEATVQGAAIAWCEGRVRGLVDVYGRIIFPRRWLKQTQTTR